MPLAPSTDLTEKPGTSSGGVSKMNYKKLSSLSPSSESKDILHRIVHLHQLTDDVSTSVLEEYFQALISKFSISRNALQDEAMRRIFLYGNVASFQYLQDAGTSTSQPLQLPLCSFPPEIKKYFDRLFVVQESESVLCGIADSIAEWLTDSPKEYQTVFTLYLQKLPLNTSRILIAALSNAEFSTSNENLLSYVSLFLKSTDKNQAQTSATFLLTCGGDLGKNFLQEMLATQELPHLQLVQSISKLLS
jgi:hypothetical protein